MGRIFISYSHKDMDFVEPVNKFLRKHNFLTWFDKTNIQPTDHWDKHIKTAIYSSDVFLMFYSRNYLDSFYCKKEFNIAKERGVNANIIIVGLDDTIDSFATHEDISNIQHTDYKYKTSTFSDLCNELKGLPCIKKCRLLNPEDIHGETIPYLTWVSHSEHPKHHNFLNLIIRFLVDLNDQNQNGLHIAKNINFSSLSYIKGHSNSKLALVNVGSYKSNENNDITFVRNIILSLFTYGYCEYTNNLPDKIPFSHVFEGNEYYEAFNKRINEIYLNVSDINETIKALQEVYNASLYYENLVYIKDHNRTLYNYEVNPLLLSICKKIFLKNNPNLIDETVRLSLPDIKTSETTYYTTSESNALNKFLATKKDLFIYSEEEIGKTKMMIDTFKNDDYTFYLDLNIYGNRFDTEIIKRSLMSMDDHSFRIDYDGLHNYSSYEHRITLLIDNFDYMPRNKRNAILEEIPYLETAFQIVLVSSTRNIENNITLNAQKSILKDFAVGEIEALNKPKIITYLAHVKDENGLGLKESIINELKELDEDNNFFKFFNSFSKLDVLFNSIKGLDNFTIKELNNDINSEIKIYQMIYESRSDYSVSKRMAYLFKDTVVPIDDVIQNLMLDEINELKKISYSNDFERINKLRFREFDCIYNILTQDDNNYKFLNDDIKSYFIASFIISSLKSYNDDFKKYEDLLKPIKNEYRVLKYLNAFEIFEYLNLNKLFDPSLKNKFMELKYIAFKIAQYNKSSRKEFASISDIEVIPDSFFFNFENVEVVMIPKSVNYIGRAVFANMTNLTKLILTSNTEELVIKPWVIINCPNLRKIKLGSNYKKLTYPLFSQCKTLESIDIDNDYFTTLEDKKMLVSKDYKTLYLCLNSLKGDIKLDERLEVLETNSLSYLDNITSIYIPRNVKELDTNFTDFSTNLEKIIVDKDNPYYYSDENGYLYQNKDNLKVLVRVPSGVTHDIIIPRDVNVIGSDSISTCAKTQRIFVPRSVKIIENYAFADTTSLTNLEFEDIEAVNKIENYIFLSTNSNLQIKINDEDEDEVINQSVDDFNKIYNRDVINEFKVNIQEKEINMDMFRNDFEVISECENKNLYSKIVVLRNISLFKNLFTYDENNYNILIIGMTEFNTINQIGSLELDEYLNKLITSRHIKLIIFTRDLPLINGLNMYKDRVSIIRTPIGTSKTTRKIIELLNREEN